MEKPIIVSFGGGVQSTAIAHMVIEDDPRIRRFGRPSLWVFADTGDEPRRVYEHVEEWGNRIDDAGMEFKVVKREDLLGEGLADHFVKSVGGGHLDGKSPPLFVRGEDGRMGPIRRQCTWEFKVVPIRRYLHARFAAVRLWMGISRDEAQRTRISNVKWIQNVYPLVEANMRRTDCIALLGRAGIDAPRSACAYCPFHSNAEWRRVREDPEDWQRAIDFERELHRIFATTGSIGMLRQKPYLHRSGVPIDQAPIDTDQVDLFSAWGNECAGVCGT